MRFPALPMAVLASAVLLAACSQVVSGAGRNGLSSMPRPPSTPSSGPPTPAPAPNPPAPNPPAAQATSCPHVVYPAAHLSFDCITSGLAPSYADPVWPLSEQRAVEPSTGWYLDEGAGHWGSPGTTSLAAIAVKVRQRMIAIGGYGANPSVHTVASRDTTVDGAPAHLLQTTFTINPSWARTDGTKVKQEKLWIIAIRVAPNDVSLWYTSLPDLVSSLWPKVPAAIASIKVG